MNFGRFIISKTFFKNLGIIALTAVVLLFVVIKGLDLYTGRGAYILIPQLDGLNGDSLVKHSDPNFLQYVVIDSVYDAKGKSGAVNRQHPLVGAKVKKGRKVYLTIVAKGREYVPMPNLVDLSIRRAIDLVQQSRLKVNQLIYVDNFARNAVLTQLIRQDTVPPDSLVLIGTPINLVIGNGHNPSGVVPPFLIGKTAADARNIILKSGFNFGGADTVSGSLKEDLRVFEQYPPYNKKEGIFLGDEMRITLLSSIDFDFDSLVFHMLNDTLVTDTLAVDSGSISNQELQEF